MELTLLAVTVELGDALERLEASGVWSFKKFEEDIEESETREAAHNADLEEISQYMRDRPEEIKNEQFKQASLENQYLWARNDDDCLRLAIVLASLARALNTS